MTLAAQCYIKDGSHPQYPHPQAETAADPYTTLNIAAKSWLSEAADGPLLLSPGRGCNDPRRRFSYRDRILSDPSRPGAPSLASLSGIGTGGIGHWIPPVGFFHLNHVPAWSDASQDFIRGHGHERSGPR